MFRRLSLALIIALVAVLGFNAVPVVPARAAVTSLADLMPGDTGAYVELRTADLDKSINSVLDLFRKADIPIPVNLYEGLDKALGDALGRDFSVQKELLGILGDSVALAAIYSDSMLSSAGNTTRQTTPAILVALQIKDDTAADALLKEVFGLLEKQNVNVTTRSITFDGNPAKRHDNRLLKFSIIQGKGILLAGTTEAVDSALLSSPKLGADPKYQKTMKLLPGNPTLKAFLGNRLYDYQFRLSASVMPSTFSVDFAKVIDGIAFSVRGEGKQLAIDFAASLNVEEAAKLPGGIGDAYTAGLGTVNTPVSFKLADQIPKNAVGVVYSSNLAQLYTSLKSQLVALSKGAAVPGLNVSEIEAGFENFESGLSENLSIDWQADVLPWLKGEYALYGVANPSGDLAISSKGDFPFDTVLILKSTDVVKTKATIAKLENLAATVGLRPAVLSEGLMIFNFPQSVVRLGIGLVDDTVIITTGSGLTAAADAVRGKDATGAKSTLLSSDIWKRASAQFPKNSIGAYYLDVTAITTLLSNLAPGKLDANAKIGVRFLSQIESAVIFGTGLESGTTTSSFIINLK